MRNGDDEGRESAIQSGWTVEGREPQSSREPAATPEESHPHAGDGADAGETDAGETDTGEGARSTPQEKTNQLSNLTVVMLGVTGGIFMLYAWVWMSWAQYYSGVNEAVAAGSGSVGGVLQQIVFWIAPLAPVLWFIAALALERTRPRRLALALLIGLIVTFPLPMVFANGAAL